MEPRNDMTEHKHHGHAHGHDHDHGHLQQHPSQGHVAPRRPSRQELQHINGWGADLDHKNRPGVPMERTPPRFINQPQGDPEQQQEKVEILVSSERPGITQVFGTVQPPSGLSGMIRRMAFKASENDLRHWLLLLLADRVNMVEGVVDDLAHGHVPNVLGEMGIKAEMKHNPAGLAKKVAITAAVVGTAVYLMKRRDRDDVRYESDRGDDRYQGDRYGKRYYR